MHGPAPRREAPIVAVPVRQYPCQAPRARVHPATVAGSPLCEIRPGYALASAECRGFPCPAIPQNFAELARFQNSGLYGALAGHRASKGVFITTATFTAQAAQFAQSVEKIVLVDGQHLAELMIDFEVGVTMRPVRVPKLDQDYFDEL